MRQIANNIRQDSRRIIDKKRLTKEDTEDNKEKRHFTKKLKPLPRTMQHSPSPETSPPRMNPSYQGKRISYQGETSITKE